ncbi:MAG TPA: cohesin domain-containing protein [Geobacteraceae bacterium]
MKSRNKNWSLIVFPILLFGHAAVCHAAGTFTVSRSGNGQYLVQGTGLNGVAGTDVVIQYDKTALANPRVVQGDLLSGSLMVTNTNKEGIVRFATVDTYPRTNSGTGTIATITFDSIGTSPANVTLLKGTAVDVNGHVVVGYSSDSAALSTSGDASDSGWSTPTGGSTTTTTGGTAQAAAGGSGSPVWLGGGVSMPGDGAKVEAKVRDEASAAILGNGNIQEKTGDTAEKENASPIGAADHQKASAENKGDRSTSVLEQFRTFQGEKTPKSLVALFGSAMEGGRQQPPLALSDGKSKVKVFVEIPPGGKTAPNFALKGAEYVSLKKSGDSAWVVEVLPTKGTFEATVTVLQDGTMRQIPLTVAPPLPAELKIGAAGKLTENDFDLFLKDRSTGKAPRFDLNGDGKRDYIDEYIFTANFLASLDAGKKSPEKQRQ